MTRSCNDLKQHRMRHNAPFAVTLVLPAALSFFKVWNTDPARGENVSQSKPNQAASRDPGGRLRQHTHTHTAQPINWWHPGATAAPGDGYNTANPATDASERLSRCQRTNISGLSSCFANLSACRETNNTKLQINSLDAHRSNRFEWRLQGQGLWHFDKATVPQDFNNWHFYLSVIVWCATAPPPYSFSNENAPKATRAAAILWNSD